VGRRARSAPSRLARTAQRQETGVASCSPCTSFATRPVKSPCVLTSRDYATGPAVRAHRLSFRARNARSRLAEAAGDCITWRTDEPLEHRPRELLVDGGLVSDRLVKAVRRVGLVGLEQTRARRRGTAATCGDRRAGVPLAALAGGVLDGPMRAPPNAAGSRRVAGHAGYGDRRTDRLDPLGPSPARSGRPAAQSIIHATATASARASGFTIPAGNCHVGSGSPRRATRRTRLSRVTMAMATRKEWAPGQEWLTTWGASSARMSSGDTGALRLGRRPPMIRPSRSR
jgi:hypothetical protein